MGHSLAPKLQRWIGSQRTCMCYWGGGLINYCGYHFVEPQHWGAVLGFGIHVGCICQLRCMQDTHTEGGVRMYAAHTHWGRCADVTHALLCLRGSSRHSDLRVGAGCRNECPSHNTQTHTDTNEIVHSVYILIIYTYIYIHTNIHIDIYRYMYLYLHIYIYLYIYLSSYMCMYVSI